MKPFGRGCGRTREIIILGHIGNPGRLQGAPDAPGNLTQTSQTLLRENARPSGTARRWLADRESTYRQLPSSAFYRSFEGFAPWRWVALATQPEFARLPDCRPGAARFGAENSVLRGARRPELT